MKTRFRWMALFLLLTGCPAAYALLHDASGKVCEMVVQDTDPSLAPICTTLAEVDQIIEQLKAQKTGAYIPTNHELYVELAKRRAGK